jgi:hypothetical protein
LLLRSREDLTQPGAEVLLSTLDSRKTRNDCLEFVKNNLQVDSKFSQNRSDNAFGLLKHCHQQMLWLDLLILTALSQLNRCLNRLLAP